MLPNQPKHIDLSLEGFLSRVTPSSSVEATVCVDEKKGTRGMVGGDVAKNCQFFLMYSSFMITVAMRGLKYPSLCPHTRISNPVNQILSKRDKNTTKILER